MEALQTVKSAMSPRLDALVEHLSDIEEGRAAAFFAEIAVALTAAEAEEDLLEVFLALSTTAFQGFEFDPVAAASIDDILAYA